MNNADKFKQIFNLYATELWAMSEKDFLAWLNEERDVSTSNVGDLISRQAAIKALCEKGMCGDKQCNAYPCEDVRAIEQVPTIDPVKHGKWKAFDLTWGRSVYACTACDEAFEVPTENGKPIYDYCPNCGARMTE